VVVLVHTDNGHPFGRRLPPEIACSVWPICWGLQITKNLSIS